MPLLPAADWRQVEFQPAAPIGGRQIMAAIPAVEQEYGVKSLELRTYELGKTQYASVGGTRGGCHVRLRTADLLPERRR